MWFVFPTRRMLKGNLATAVRNSCWSRDMHSSVPLIVFIPADKLTNGEGSSVMGDICKKYVSLPLVFIVQIHTVRGTGVLQQYVDKQQLPEEMDGDFTHCHSDWLVFRLVRISCLLK